MIDGILLACRYYALDTDSLEALWDFEDLYSPMTALAPTTGATLDAN